MSCCTTLRRFTVFQRRLKSLERREDFFLGGGRDLVTAHATSSGSGTNVTGEPHQSAPQRFDYCQERQRHIKVKKRDRVFQPEATLQSSRGSDRWERLSSDREKELLLHNTSPPVGLHYLFLILLLVLLFLKITPEMTSLSEHLSVSPWKSTGSWCKSLTRVLSHNELNTLTLDFCNGRDCCICCWVKVVAEFDFISKCGSVNFEAEHWQASVLHTFVKHTAWGEEDKGEATSWHDLGALDTFSFHVSSIITSVCVF